MIDFELSRLDIQSKIILTLVYLSIYLSCCRLPLLCLLLAGLHRGPSDDGVDAVDTLTNPTVPRYILQLIQHSCRLVKEYVVLNNRSLFMYSFTRPSHHHRIAPQPRINH